MHAHFSTNTIKISATIAPAFSDKADNTASRPVALGRTDSHNPATRHAAQHECRTDTVGRRIRSSENHRQAKLYLASSSRERPSSQSEE